MALASLSHASLGAVAQPPLDPLPRDDVGGGGEVEARPALVVGSADEVAVHHLADVLAVGAQHDFACPVEGFEANPRGDDFGLLVGG